MEDVGQVVNIVDLCEVEQFRVVAFDGSEVQCSVGEFDFGDSHGGDPWWESLLGPECSQRVERANELFR